MPMLCITLQTASSRSIIYCMNGENVDHPFRRSPCSRRSHYRLHAVDCFYSVCLSVCQLPIPLLPCLHVPDSRKPKIDLQIAHAVTMSRALSHISQHIVVRLFVTSALMSADVNELLLCCCAHFLWLISWRVAV